MSYNIALSGLKATSQDLNTISNNIANQSTVGFRGGRSEFAAIYNGGQPGGVGVLSTSQNFALSGNLTYTGRELDMGLQGDGFFVLNSQDGNTVYARAGMFIQDAEGNIVDPAGNKLQGYATNNGLLQTGNVTDLTVQTSALPAKATTDIGLVSNFDARVDEIDPVATPFDPDDASTFHSSNTVSVFDSLGSEHALTQYYVKTGSNSWDVQFRMGGEDVTPAGGYNMTFDTDGNLTSASNLNLTITNPAIIDGASALNFEVDYQSSTQYAAAYNNSSLSQNGYTSGELNGIRLDENGQLYGTYTNGQEQLQGQVVLADFTNPNGLEPISNNAWTASNEAGQPILGTPSTGTLGSLKGGYLEGSNVDATAEMVSLMTAQRNYQSNAKVLDTNSTMQQALLNVI
ncbi:flagellar basal body protein FlgE [Shewanella sp. 202IG2-18]|uniref:flagellar hook protein FlgE n=1 Tax=Parashewanella hymeniacidonis TaxID=2807618 RepID=UPI00195F7F55|nr:flagellar hook protein FlgE [Parashewanella hymeniacidonis]MBM7072860.1 flagellar basal body protein FlgE [Parashewanella hymeniacidonis]